MKKLLFFTALLILASTLSAQTALNDNAKLASLCKVWGFLKYYHPTVAKGKTDWDHELLTHIQPVLAASDRQELSRVYTEWIHDLGSIKPRKHPRKPIPDSMNRNLDLEWMDDTILFTDSLSAMLHYVEQNKKGYRNHYVRSNAFTQRNPVFTHEKPYPDSLYPAAGMRLLCLFRYWNTISYFYPCKYACDTDWDVVLDEMIPKFRSAADNKSYIMAMMEMTSKTDDSHTEFFNPEATHHLSGSTVPSFLYQIVDNKVVVTGFKNDSLTKLDDIRYGDVILSASGKPVTELIRDKSKYVSGSNAASKIHKLWYQGWLFYEPGDSMEIVFERNGITKTKYIKKYTQEQLNYDWEKKQNTAAVKILPDNIGYLDLALLKRKQIRCAMKEVKNTGSLILDVRNYPPMTANSLARRLNKERKPFINFVIGHPRFPGNNRHDYVQKCGRKNKHYYKGKVIVLFNASTQSYAEFAVMGFQTAPNVTCIGSQTAAANGSVAMITLPGGYKTRFSVCSPIYPDGRSLVRKGLTPDIEVKPTIEGIRMHKDEELERALEYARTGK